MSCKNEEIEGKTLDAKELLDAYRQLWTKRVLPVENGELKTLKSAIEKDLRDEMTHPRLRKNKYEKFHLAIKRIVFSSLNDSEKVGLIVFHNNVLEKLEAKNLEEE